MLDRRRAWNVRLSFFLPREAAQSGLLIIKFAHQVYGRLYHHGQSPESCVSFAKFPFRDSRSIFYQICMSVGLLYRVHRPERIVVAPCFDVVERFIRRRQREIARRNMARIDDAALHQLQ